MTGWQKQLQHAHFAAVRSVQAQWQEAAKVT